MTSPYAAGPVPMEKNPIFTTTPRALAAAYPFLTPPSRARIGSWPESSGREAYHGGRGQQEDRAYFPAEPVGGEGRRGACRDERSGHVVDRRELSALGHEVEEGVHRASRR